MARLQSQIDLCHVPSPDCVVDWLATVLDIPDGCHIIDPCCGTGEAVRRLAPKGVIYGVELDGARARAARTRLDMVLSGPMQDAHVGSARFGMLFLNPPYDASLGGRLELVFLKTCSRWLDVNGVLVLIIKQGQYTASLNERLNQVYEPIVHLQFPPGYYNGPHLAFTQTVLIARKRVKPGKPDPSVPYLMGEIPPGRIWSSTAQARLALPIPVKVGQAPTNWASSSVTPEEAAQAMAVSEVPRFQEEGGLIRAGSPPLPLKRGHLAQALASGVINGVYGQGADRHVSRGTVTRTTKRQSDVIGVDRSELATVLVTDTDQFEVNIRTAYRDGTIETLK